MIRAPRIRAPAKATSEPRLDTIAGSTPSPTVGAASSVAARASSRDLLVETELLDRILLRRVDRCTDLVGLVEHATDGGGHDDGHQQEQPEHEHAGRVARLEPMSLEAPGHRLEDHGENGREQEGERDLADRGQRRDHDDRGDHDAHETPGPRADPRERSAGVVLGW